MKETNQLKAGALLSYLNLIIGTIIPFLYTPIMLRVLGQAEYGLYSLSGSVIGYLSLLTLGMGSAIGRYYIKYLTEKNRDMMEKVIGLFLVLYAIIAVVSLCVGIGITFFTSVTFAKGLEPAEIQKLNILISIMTISTALSLVTAPYGTIVTCHEQYVFQKTVAICGTLATPVLNLVAMYAGYGSVGLAVVSIIIQLSASFATIWFCTSRIKIRPQFHNLPWWLMREILSFSIFVFIGMIADMLYWATDKVLIGALISSSAVAVYNIGITFNTMLHQISSAISNIFTPRVNKMVFGNSTMADMSAMLIRVGRIQYIIVSLVVSGFVVFGQPFLVLWSGTGYEDAYYVALLTMIPTVIPLIMNIAYNTIVAQNRHQFRSVLYTILAVVNVISSYFLIPVMGIVGAALCTCIVFVLGHGFIMNWFYYKKIGLDIPTFWNNILKMTIVPAVMVIACFLVDIQPRSLWELLFDAGIYTVIFCGLSWLFSMNRYEKDLVLGLLKKLDIRKKK